MRKGILYGAFLFVFGIFFVSSSSVYASELVDDNAGGEIIIQEGAEEPARSNDASGDGSSAGTEANDSNGISATEEKTMKIGLLSYADGEVTLAQVYDVLVSIYNLGIIAGFLCLMVWTYEMITKSFRRFIG